MNAWFVLCYWIDFQFNRINIPTKKYKKMVSYFERRVDIFVVLTISTFGTLQ